MSILSTNNANFKITLEYLRERGYKWRGDEHKEPSIIFREILDSSSWLHVYRSYKDGFTELHFKVFFDGIGEAEIDTLHKLSLVEQYWNSSDIRTKNNIKFLLMQ